MAISCHQVFVFSCLIEASEAAAPSPAAASSPSAAGSGVSGSGAIPASGAAGACGASTQVSCVRALVHFVPFG